MAEHLIITANFKYSDFKDNTMDKKPQAWKLNKFIAGTRSKRGPPTAPSKAEQSLYRKYAKIASKNKIRNCLILGATPELRDIALENGFRTYSVDLSRKVINLFSKLMKHRNHKNETVKVQNWLKLRFKDSFFSLVMADASFCNLSTRAENRKLMGIVKKVLIPGGYFVSRNIFCPDERRIPVKKLVSLYRKNKLPFPDFFMQLRAVTYLDKVYNKRKYQYDAKRNFDLIEKDYKKGIFTKKERDKIMGFRNNIINTLYPEKNFIKMAESHGFRMIKVFKDNKYRFTKYLYMQVCQRKPLNNKKA